ncbi:MAG: 6-phosphofructokinase [Anaerolineae bacterium]|nr:6-phosphofructokinase [Anaerolineae bacterium]
MKIGVLTGGGDVPGLNPVIKALTYRAIDEGHTVVGFRRGWAGLLNYNPDDPQSREWLVLLDKMVTRRIDREGGTFLHASRTNPGKVMQKHVPAFLRDADQTSPDAFVDMTPHVLKVLDVLGIDVLVPIGGEDTLGYGARIHREGFPIISIPKTMDNDVFGTDYCIGFSTAVTRAVKFTHQLRTPIGSHERLGVIELFGRQSGETALVSAYLAGADRALICEVPFEMERLATLLLQDKASNPSHYAIVIVSEGAKMLGGKLLEWGDPDAYGHRKLGGIGRMVGDLLHDMTGYNTVYQSLGYLMRSGPPDSLDLMVAVNFANMTLDLIQDRIFGRMVALRDGQYTSVVADAPLLGTKRVDVEQLYDVDAYRPKIRHIQRKPMFLY